jgi:hypothetical protein
VRGYRSGHYEGCDASRRRWLQMTIYTVWQLSNGAVSVPQITHTCEAHAVSRDKARHFAVFLNRHYGRAYGFDAKFVAGPVDAPPPVEAFE